MSFIPVIHQPEAFRLVADVENELIVTWTDLYQAKDKTSWSVFNKGEIEQRATVHSVDDNFRRVLFETLINGELEKEFTIVDYML